METTQCLSQCSADAVPYSRAELSNFDEVKAVAEEFQNFLVEKVFLRLRTRPLWSM